jgi:acetyl-CoA C-acetyltransferase
VSAPAAVIVATARSPIGRAGKGSLRELRADDLAATIVEAALAKVPQLNPNEVDEILVGCGQPAGEQGYGIGRVVAVLLGLSHVPAATIQRYCASSLSAARSAYHAIVAGEAEVVVVAGVESISRYGAGKADGMPDTKNPRFGRDGLPDLYMPMGLTAEKVAAARGVTRTDQDAFAARSQQRTQKARENGFFDWEITPVRVSDGRLIDADDSPRDGVTPASLAELKPAFLDNGTVTAGNCCPMNDGAAALVMMSDRRAAALGITPLARVVSTGVSALDPELMGLGPVESSRRALAAAGMSIRDIDIVEINEAFAAQVLPCCEDLGADLDRVNPFGGAIALGHPFGMTGARMVGTAINGLRERDGQRALVTLCAAGGQGLAMVIERCA